MSSSAGSRGLIAGIGVAIILLAAAAAWLMSVEATSIKVLIAVWLWALPVLGICSAAGYGVGRLIQAMGEHR